MWPFQILLSISLFFLFFLSYPTSWPPTTNPKPFKPFLSAFISNRLSFDVNRNLMFLLCNAILVFVTGGFGYFSIPSKAVDQLRHPSVLPVEDKEVIVESTVVKNGVSGIEVEDGQEEEATAADQEKQCHQHRPHHQHGHHHQRHHRRRQQRKQQQQHHHHHHPQLQPPVQEEEEENEEEKYRLQQQKLDERSGLMPIEESDERFDNFIKQVKEGMRMEAKQLQLTA